MLSKEDVDQIVAAMDKRQTYPVIDRRSEYFIDPKAHYDQHARMDRMLDMLEGTASTVWKIVLALVVTGILGAILLAIKMQTR